MNENISRKQRQLQFFAPVFPAPDRFIQRKEALDTDILPLTAELSFHAVDSYAPRTISFPDILTAPAMRKHRLKLLQNCPARYSLDSFAKNLPQLRPLTYMARVR